jgi:hypothetical protein
MTLSLIGVARADESREPPGFVVIPPDCLQFWSMPGGIDSPASWNQVLSFGACIQDATVMHVDRVDQLADMVNELDLSLAPAIEIYASAVEQGPEHVQVRAALQIAMAEVAMIVRARSSIAAPSNPAIDRPAAARYRELHARLEPMLARTARLTCFLIARIDQEVTREPSLAADAVTQGILASAREAAVRLRRSMSIPEDGYLRPTETVAAKSDARHCARSWQRCCHGAR